MSRRLVSRQGVGSTAVVIQKGSVCLHHIVFESPSLVFVRSGTKTIRRGELSFVVSAGRFLALNGPSIFDVTNSPAPDGLFEATWLSFDASLIRQYRDEARSPVAIDTAYSLLPTDSEFLDAYAKAIDGLNRPESIPEAVSIQRMREVLAWIDANGRYFPPRERLSTSEKIRRTVSDAPHVKWTAPEVAQRWAMSEATLRRKLSSEGESFSRLLKEVRLSYALVLLQATDYSVDEVARRSGYDNASRFAQTFKRRFGHSPRHIRLGAE